jgi:hypothetical protein
MPDDEESPPSPVEVEEEEFLAIHAGDETMTREEEEAIKKDNPGPVPQDVA